MKGSLPKRVHVCRVQLLFLTEKKVVILLARQYLSHKPDKSTYRSAYTKP